VDKTYTPVLKSMSMFPILPSFSWSVKFWCIFVCRCVRFS
jgi:hypothetical protein